MLLSLTNAKTMCARNLIKDKWLINNLYNNPHKPCGLSLIAAIQQNLPGNCRNSISENTQQINIIQKGLNDKQNPICLHSSISRASVWRLEEVGWIGRAPVPNPGGSLSVALTAILAQFPQPTRRWGWYFTTMASWHLDQKKKLDY